ncbi:Got1/Sft2-like family vesicle transport protein [Candidatus Daviesbacteria bacterium]|nr:Got1/Sft2-like family vesicle transport protein [Candidatus Daviesbacteria bacterium]
MPKDTPKHNPPKENQPPRPVQSVPPEFFTPKMMEAEEIKTLLSWEAPSRPFRKKDRSYYTTITILVILVVFTVVFWLHDYLLIGAILSVAFVTYVLAFVPPHNIRYKISTQGITIGEDFYFWHFLDAFWFKEKDKITILHIQTRLRFPAQLMLVLGNENEEKIKKVVARFLPYVEVPYKSWMEKWSESLQKHFPLENVHR